MLKNFLWQREDQPHNMLSYIFLFINAVYGVTFTFFSSSATVQGSAFVMHALPPELWGLACIVLVLGTLITIQWRRETIGKSMGFLGVLVWGYGLFLYLASGTLFAALAIYLPQLLFWLFWYIGVRRYYVKKHNTEV